MSFSATTLPLNHALISCDIRSVLGEGGFGIVYRAWDRQLERFIAVKEYMPSALAVRGLSHEVRAKSPNNVEPFEAGRKSFLNEARMVARFEHPSVVKIYQFWEENGTAYIAMPLHNGKTLRDVLRARTTAPDEAWIKALLLPLLDALSLLHAHQCYHRDIAPDNILILEDKSPVLIDFGAARRVIGDMTQALTAVLKPGFAPIEQYADSNAVAQGPWTDIYALSAVIHYVLTGKAPPTSVARVMNDTYEPLEQRLAGRYCVEFLRALDRGLSVSPTTRPQTAEQFRAFLFPTDIAPTLARNLNLNQNVAAVSSTNIIETMVVDSNTRANDLVDTKGKFGSTSRLIIGVIVAAVGALCLLLFASGGFRLRTDGGLSSPVHTKPTADQVAGAQGTTFAVPRPALSADNFYEFLLSNSTPADQLAVKVDKERYAVDKDKINFQLSPSFNGFVYIFLINAKGKAQLVFPNLSEKNHFVKAGVTVILPRENNFVASEPLGKSSAIVILSASARNFDAILDPTSSDFPEISLTKLKSLNLAGEQARALGVMHCENKPPTCEGFSVARVGFETFR